MNLFLLISAVPVIGYLVLIAILFRPISSISESYYEWDKRRKGLGWLFYGWCILTVASVCPALFEWTEGEWYQFLTLFAAFGLLLTGASPLFKDSQKKTHYVGACTSAATIFAIIALKGHWGIEIIVLSMAAILTKLQSQSRTYWFESAVIVCIYVVLLI